MGQQSTKDTTVNKGSTSHNGCDEECDKFNGTGILNHVESDTKVQHQNETLTAPIAQPEVVLLTKRRKKCVTYELQPENVSPQHEDYRVFVVPQWDAIPQLPYVCYRVAVAILICAWVSVDFIQEGGKFYSDNMLIWLIFATNWGFICLAVSAVIRAVASLYYYTESRQKECEAQTSTLSFMVLWVVYNIAANCALVVTVAYWTYLTAFDNAGFLNTRMCELKHTLNSCYILFDLLISALPIRIFHMVYPITVGAIYTVFNAVYFINDGVGPDGKSYAYVVMDWDDPLKSALMCSLGFLVAAFMQFVLYAFYKLRLFICASCVRDGPMTTRHFSDSDHVTRCGNVGNKAEIESILPESQECGLNYNAVQLSAVVPNIEVVDETSPAIR